MTEQNLGGRPRGIVSRCITIDDRNDNAGFYVYIGLDIYERLGKPEYIMLEAREHDDGGVPTAWRIRPAREDEEGRYKMTVVGDNRPRFALGKARHEELRLDIGQYPAMIWNGQIVF